MLKVTEHDVELADGRTLHYYDTSTSDGRTPETPVFYSHGSPNLGEPPAPMFEAAEALGIRFLGYDRPGYGPSTLQRGRTVASSVQDLAAIADALGIERFGLLGHSGGGPHVLAAAALMPERITAVVCGSGVAPLIDGPEDYFTGMGAAAAAEMRAAVEGREALERHLAESEFDPELFTPEDFDALMGSWTWLARIAGRALENGGVRGYVDDNLAFVAPWGFEVSAVAAPTLVLHGDADRMVPISHGRWTASQVQDAELLVIPGAGHVSVLESTTTRCLEWLKERTKTSTTTNH